jgi:metal-sulfur cluster biosynthetic enzyme
MTSGPLSITQLLGPGSEAEQLRELLREVIDPELGIDIVSLGLVYDVKVEGRAAQVVATMTTPACPLAEYLSGEIERTLLESGAVDRVEVRITYSPPWGPHMMADSARRMFGWS